jgi:hypothetical protein
MIWILLILIISMCAIGYVERKPKEPPVYRYNIKTGNYEKIN